MNFKKLIGQFIGHDKIKKASLHDSKTYFDKERVLIEFENDSSYILPLEVLPQVITPERLEDLAELQRMRTEPSISAIIAVLTEAELTMTDIKHAINSRLWWTINQNMEDGATFLWGSSSDMLTLHHIDNVLREMANKKPKVKKKKKK